jgi:dTDP-glucose 4,6-dehydratase
MEGKEGQLKLLVTGGAGFIGSNFIRYILKNYPEDSIINIDKLTYAGNPANMRDFDDNPRYGFIQADICDEKLIPKLAKKVDIVVNFAAETHVDRSIGNPGDFVKTDVLGTYNILEAVKAFNKRLVHISTDEVYGTVLEGSSKETDPFSPSSPYSASKAGADHLALSYFTTYGTDVVVTRSSNNYGPYQYPEKLIPLFITNAIEGKPLPIYGDGKQMRDWLFVTDNCEGIDLVMRNGKKGEAYNIGTGNEETNIVITKTLLRLLKKPESLIQYVKDRPGHDRRYSLSIDKVRRLGWSPRIDLTTGLKQTVEWYAANPSWWQPLKSGKFLDYYKKHYRGRHGME